MFRDEEGFMSPVEAGRATQVSPGCKVGSPLKNWGELELDHEDKQYPNP
jgi:hypothetical protein